VRGMEPFALEAGDDEGVDRVQGKADVRSVNFGEFGPFGRDERPERLPRRALFEPGFEEFDLCGREGRFAGVGRRHALGGVGGGGAADEFVLQSAGGAIEVEAEAGLAVGDVGAVAGYR